MLHHPSFIGCIKLLLSIQIKIREKFILVTVLFDWLLDKGEQTDFRTSEVQKSTKKYGEVRRSTKKSNKCIGISYVNVFRNLMKIQVVIGHFFQHDIFWKEFHIWKQHWILSKISIFCCPKMTFIFHGSLGTGRELHHLPNKMFFSKCLIHRTFDAEFDAESKYQFKICTQWNFTVNLLPYKKLLGILFGLANFSRALVRKTGNFPGEAPQNRGFSYESGLLLWEGDWTC
jgi:hypothetical protein